jgi:hypothetical protein
LLFHSFKDSSASQQQDSPENAANMNEDANEDDDEMEWDNSWIQLQTIPEETNQDLKKWENTGEGVACLTFLQGQVIFKAEKLKKCEQKSSLETNEMTEVQIHGVPFEDTEQPIQSTEQEATDDFPDPPTELELAEMMEKYQTTYL